MKLNITPQAQSFWVSADVGFTEIQHDLDRMWAETETKDSKWNMPKLPSGLPKNRETYERHCLADLYRDYWIRRLVDGVEFQQGLKQVCYVTELGAQKLGAVYHLNALFFFEPALVIDGDSVKAAERNFGNVRVTEAEIVESLAMVRAKHIFDTALEYVDGEPIKDGDTVNVFADHDEVKKHGLVARRMIITLDEQCEPQWKQALIGHKIGHEVNLELRVNENDPNEGVIQAKLKVKNKIKPEAMDDERLYQLEKVENKEQLVEKIKNDILNFKKGNNGQMLLRFLLKFVQMEPIPGALVHDRVAGYLAYLNRNPKEMPQDLKGLSVEQQLQALLPRVRTDYVEELMAKMLNARYGVKLTEEEVEARMVRDDHSRNWESEYVARTELHKEKFIAFVKEGLQVEGKVEAKPSLILPGDKNFKMPPKGTEQAASIIRSLK